MRLSIIIPVPPGAQLPEHDLTGLGGVEVIVTQGRAAAQQRNHAARIATAPVLYFLDDDSQVDPATIRRGLGHFEDPQVAAVGGPALTRRTASFWEGCFGEVTSSGFGAGRVKARNRAVGRLRRCDGEELILCNLMLRKSAYQAVEGFDDDLYHGEDVDLWKRLRRSDAVMLYDPEMVVYRPRRPTLRAFLLQYLRYGQGRGCRWSAGDLPFLLPLLFVLYLALLPWLGPRPLLAYLGLALVASLRIAARTGSLRRGLCCWPLFPGLHVAYGVGLGLGLLGLRPAVRPSTPKLTVRHYG